jgi:hypothetical protein
MEKSQGGQAVTPVSIEPDPYQRALKDIRLAREELREANERIKRLEEALAEIAYAASHPLGAGQSLTLGKIESIAIKAKEAKA